MDNNESLKNMMAEMLPHFLEAMTNDPEAFLKAIIPKSELNISEYKIKTINEIIYFDLLNSMSGMQSILCPVYRPHYQKVDSRRHLSHCSPIHH